MLKLVRLDIFMAVKIQVMVFWAVTLCSVVVWYQCFGGSCCLHLYPEGGSTIKTGS